MATRISRTLSPPSWSSGLLASDTDKGQFSQKQKVSNQINFDTVVETPSPDTYRQPTNIDLEFQRSSAYYKGKKKSFCFGAGREDFKKSITNENHVKSGQKYPDGVVPGPGNYADETRNIGVNARKWSLQGRTEICDDLYLAKKHNLPGPGTYND